MTGLEFLSINEFAINEGYGNWSNAKGGEFVVNISRLKGKIDSRNRIISGHLLPYIVQSRDLDFVATLRCSPTVLRERYLKRGYPPEKILENLEAEVIGLIAGQALEVYGMGKLGEFDTSKARNPRTIAKRILDTLQGYRAKSFGQVDWLSQTASPTKLKKALYAGIIQNRTKKDN